MLKRDSYTVSLLPVHREFLYGERFIWEIYSDISGMEAKLFSGRSVSTRDKSSYVFVSFYDIFNELNDN